MSIAGIRSNRGDGYQTLVAFDWALTVLSDPDFQWIEVDSITYLVDDVVVGKTDGTQICCQCKKNQIDFEEWTIADLADELVKAFPLLANNQKAEVRFYSRSPFGALAKLREHSTTQANEAIYRASLSQNHQKLDVELAARIATQTANISTYEFLRRTKFETSPELDRMEELLGERLRFIASNPKAAFDALWTRLDKLGARIEGSGVSASAQHRLTKDDLKDILHQAGAMLAPIMNIAEVRESFASTSVIGRSWHRDIAGQRISSPTVDALLAAIYARKRAILLTGLPGSGKTCVMLALQEALEKRAQIRTDMVPVFIQSREFADLATAQDRQSQGLPEDWVGKAARMAEGAQVVVVIDSLDVLSIAREHRVLRYFLAQIDRLLLIPNITVVTACRDFDRHHDRRIAERQWDCELKCQPLNWDGEIAPLLDKLGIHTTTIDDVTRELIRNPRELALFVELAQREGSFNVVTSQALAQRYLDTIVRANDALGETAMKAIEALANEMLRLRSLAVPHQRFTASQDIQRMLCSLNVLQETQDGKLTFGHQTLLDVLVISGAVRQDVTLNKFIQGLSPVPFVRPSIRSFVAQLAVGERREFRKQLRAVLTGNTAFHIRRLVAESFCEQTPQDEDWPLIRDLRDKHREVFQVIYNDAAHIQWHQFWLRYLVPVLKDAQDSEGMAAHVHRVAQWKNDDTVSVLKFWTEALSLDWVDGKKFSEHLGFYLSEVSTESLVLIRPLLEQLLGMPRSEHDFGRAVGRCVVAGAVDDQLLWRYIAGDINDEDVRAFYFGDKLRCQSLELKNGNDNLLRQRMVQSTPLLDLALESIEKWSQIKSVRFGGTVACFRFGFLDETSYADAHGGTDSGCKESQRILLDAIEAAILNHAQTHSDWWQTNRERLCFNGEGALRYFAILACTAVPADNIDLIGRMLCDENLLVSGLSYELGTLAAAAFIFVNESTQDAIMAAFLAVHKENETDECDRLLMRRQTELIIAIPCHLRSIETQAVLDAYERVEGRIVREPTITYPGGFMSTPFSFDVFLNDNDSGVLRLLAHYSGREGYFDDSWVSGDEEVGGQLREASSRDPSRFLHLLSTQWVDVPESFRNGIMDGVANYLMYKYGKLKHNNSWTPRYEPNASTLADQILDELERHPNHWQSNNSTSIALQACANVIHSERSANRLVFLAIGFRTIGGENSVQAGSVDLRAVGINLAVGRVAEALMILAIKLQEQSVPFPELLPPTLRRFAGHEHPAIRALMLRRLPYLQGLNPELGWDLFHRAMRNAEGLWQSAESCLYYAYHNHFDRVSPLLARIYSESSGNDLETWGRISALAALRNHIDSSVFLDDLKALNATEAWRGAASVWTDPGNIKQHGEQCINGIRVGLNADRAHASAVAEKMGHVFSKSTQTISIPIELIRQCFKVIGSDSENRPNRFVHFPQWLNATSHHDPEQALTATEIYLDYVVNLANPYVSDFENSLTQLMTRLFAEAEEREESDNGEMLQQVVSIQDRLLSLGVNGIPEWLNAAERQ